MRNRQINAAENKGGAARLTPGRLLWLLRSTLSRGLRASFHFHRTAPKIWARSALTNTGDPEPTPVHVLTGSEGVTMTGWMLASFFHTTQRNWQVIIHDDGTLDDGDRERLRNLLPTIAFAPRNMEARMAETLAPHPRCLAYRQRHPLAKKCFDIPALVDTPRFLILDSDVLFFQRPDEILDWVDAGDEHPDSWFNADFQEPSPIPPDHAEEVFGHPLWPKVNSGLCLLRRDAIDFTDHDRYLACDQLREGNPWRIEQALLALSASKSTHGGLLPASYEVSPNKKRAEGCIARHYVGEVRHHFYGEGIRALAPPLLGS